MKYSSTFPFLKSRTIWPLLLSAIASINVFTLSYFDLGAYQKFHLIVFTYLLYASLFVKRRMPDGFHGKLILLMTLLPLLSVYSCHALHGQSYMASLVVYRMHLGWLCYFALWHKRVSLNHVYKVVFIVGFLYATITVIQQATYPFAPFGARTLGTDYASLMGGVEKRMGFYRYSVGGLQYAVISLFLCLVCRRNIKNYMVIAFLIVSIIASGNRQTIFAVFLSICYYLFYNRNLKHKLPILLAISAFVLVIYIYADVWFGALVNIQSDYNEGRAGSVTFFWSQVTDNWLSFLFGNGLGHKSSTYGNTIYYTENGRKAIFSDIGILGTMYLWGILYVATYYILAIRTLSNRFLSVQFKAILLYFIVASPIAPFLFEIEGLFLQGLLFYLCDLNIQENKNKTKKTERRQECSLCS